MSLNCYLLETEFGSGFRAFRTLRDKIDKAGYKRWFDLIRLVPQKVVSEVVEGEDVERGYKLLIRFEVTRDDELTESIWRIVKTTPGIVAPENGAPPVFHDEDAGEILERLRKMPPKRWYVVHAFSGYEQRAMETLGDHVEQKEPGYESLFDELLVPTEEVVEMRAGQKRNSKRKFFPGYVLVHMELNDDTWHLVKETPRVMGFIGGTAEKPAPITDREAASILRRIEDSEGAPAHKTIYEPGEMVRIVDGPFNDFTGTVEEVNYEKSRLRVAVLIFGRATPVELEFGQVEKS